MYLAHTVESRPPEWTINARLEGERGGGRRGNVFIVPKVEIWVIVYGGSCFVLLGESNSSESVKYSDRDEKNMVERDAL